MLFNIPFTPNWNQIEHNKQKIINRSSIAENDKRIKYDYEVDDDVYIYTYWNYRKLEGPCLGPFETVQVYTNGTVYIRGGTTSERISIGYLTSDIVKEM